LLENIGMRREGHFIKNTWYKGEYTDEYLFAMLKEEWK
jgi:aminoglycoside 6'-N-acetyltransferase